MAGAAKTFLAQPFSGARGLIIAPFQFETTEDDNLRIESANSLSGVVLTIQGRRRTAAGSIEPFSRTHLPNSDRSVKTEDYKLGAGALLNLTIFASFGAPLIGQTYVSARFIRGLSGATIVLGTLLAGYVTAAQHIAYPGSPIQSSIEGGGYLRFITGTVPAAGVGVSEVVPTGARWELTTLHANLQTNATVTNRRPYLQFISNGIILNDSRMPALQAASLAASYYWSPGMPLESSWGLNSYNAGLPTPSPLLAGDSMTVNAENFQAGDQFTGVWYQVKEWLEVSA